MSKITDIYLDDKVNVICTSSKGRVIAEVDYKIGGATTRATKTGTITKVLVLVNGHFLCELSPFTRDVIFKDKIHINLPDIDALMVDDYRSVQTHLKELAEMILDVGGSIPVEKLSKMSVKELIGILKPNGIDFTNERYFKEIKNKEY